MKIGNARAIVDKWVREQGAHTPGYLGAWLAGSAALLPDDATLAVGSDVDVVILLASSELLAKPGKFVHQGLLLEVTWVSQQRLLPLDALLEDYHLGNSLWARGRADCIIDDPTGIIRATHDALSRSFTHETQVLRRCASVRQRIETGLAFRPEDAAFHEHLLAWLFPTGVLCHLPLVAALQNPTVRQRYVVAREVLALYGMGASYPLLLHTLGSEAITKQQVAHHLNNLEETFDAAAKTSLTDLPFASDITPAARTIAIDGSRSMIDAGDHREAAFWIAVTFARCHAVLALNEPTTGERLYPDFMALCGELGVGTLSLLRMRAVEVTSMIPLLWDVTLDIIEKNPNIERGDAADYHSRQKTRKLS